MRLSAEASWSCALSQWDGLKQSGRRQNLRGRGATGSSLGDAWQSLESPSPVSSQGCWDGRSSATVAQHGLTVSIPLCTNEDCSPTKRQKAKWLGTGAYGAYGLLLLPFLSRLPSRLRRSSRLFRVLFVSYSCVLHKIIHGQSYKSPLSAPFPCARRDMAWWCWWLCGFLASLPIGIPVVDLDSIPR